MIKKIKQFFIKLTADIYLSKKPFFLLYKPELHKLKGHEIRVIINTLKKGDILLRRYHGYLNTKLTPGFWGHAALYIGNDTVIHALSCGVVKEDILDFCRCDDIAIVRVRKATNNDIQDVVFTAKEMVRNKVKYDFDFESGDDEVYCTELIDDCYNGIFKGCYSKILSITALTPDAIYNSDKVVRIISFKH